MRVDLGQLGLGLRRSEPEQEHIDVRPAEIDTSDLLGPA
jgi:hypothetical protein